MRRLRLLSLLVSISLILPLCVFAEEATKTYGTPYFTIRLPEQNFTATEKDAISEYIQSFLGASKDTVSEYIQSFLGASIDVENVFFSYDPVRGLYWFATADAVSGDKVVPDLLPSEISQLFDAFYSKFNKIFSFEKWQTGHLEHDSGTMLRFDFVSEYNGVTIEQVHFILPLRKSDQNYNVNLMCNAYGVMSEETLDYIDNVLLNHTFFPGSLPKIISEAERAKQATRSNSAEQVPQSGQARKPAQTTVRSGSAVQAEYRPQSGSNIFLYILLFVIVATSVFILFAILLKKSKKSNLTLKRLYVIFFWAFLCGIVVTVISRILHFQLGGLPTVIIGAVCFIPSRIILHWLKRPTYENSNIGNRTSSVDQPSSLMNAQALPKKIIEQSNPVNSAHDSNLAETSDEDEAKQEELTVVEPLRSMCQSERENDESLRKQTAELVTKWKREAEEASRVYPDFDFLLEQNDPITGKRFMNMVKNGVDVRSAYEVIHIKELTRELFQEGDHLQ